MAALSLYLMDAISGVAGAAAKVLEDTRKFTNIDDKFQDFMRQAHWSALYGCDILPFGGNAFNVADMAKIEPRVLTYYTNYAVDFVYKGRTYTKMVRVPMTPGSGAALSAYILMGLRTKCILDMMEEEEAAAARAE